MPSSYPTLIAAPYSIIYIMLRRDELEAQLRRFLLHVFDLLFLVLLLILVHAQWVIFHFVLQHSLHYTRNRVGGRNRCLRRSSRDLKRRYSIPNGQSACFTDCTANLNTYPARI